MSTATTFRFHNETVGGVEIEKPVPKRLHAIIQKRILLLLEKQLDGTAYESLPELDLLCGLDRYCPDVMVARTDAHFRDGTRDEAPALVVEIMSPGQTIGRLFEKCEVYLRHGAAVCWIVWPERRQAWTFTKDVLQEVFTVKDESLVSSSPTLQARLKDLFHNLPDALEP